MNANRWFYTQGFRTEEPAPPATKPQTNLQPVEQWDAAARKWVVRMVEIKEAK